MPLFTYVCEEHGEVDRLVSRSAIEAGEPVTCSECGREMTRKNAWASGNAPGLRGLPTTGSKCSTGKVQKVGYFGYDNGGGPAVYGK